MVPVKICGMRRLEDIQFINELQPEYIGFIFAPSKRQVTPDTAKELINKVKKAACVGVFVNERLENIVQIADNCNLDVIQLHGSETQEDILFLKEHTHCAIWKALRLRNHEDLSLIKQLTPDRFLLDSFHETMAGGSGRQIHLDLLKDIDVREHFIAGGIHAGNVNNMLALHPYGIDVSSGVEINGYKDYYKIKELLKEVRK